VAAFRQQVQAYINVNLSPAARSKILADTARAGLADLIATGRASTSYNTFVDGRRDGNEDDVIGTGGGSILYRFDMQAQAAVFALAFLMARGPARSGKFRNSFFVGVDGRFVAAAQFNPDSVQPGAEIVIGNTLPQTRKIDVQLANNTRLRYLVPSGMFDDCVAALKSKFGGSIAARRVGNLRFPGQYTLRDGTRRGESVQSPAVAISAV
jgi:hypothetical protein